MEYIIDETKSINETLKKCVPYDTIYLKNGIYHEKIKILVPNITIIGESNKAIIVNKDYYNKIHEDNKEYLTVRTYTLMVLAKHVTLKNLTIKNEATPSSIYGQAVSLHVIGDDFKAYNLKILGAQDTLLSGPIPYDLTIRYKDLLPKDELTIEKSHQYYESCYIEGDTDFIFGSGIAYFNHCTLHSINKGYIAAPSHPKEYPYGFVFNECTITSNNLDDCVYLGRPWRDYGNCAFINTKIIGNSIKKEGYHFWQESRKLTSKLKIYKTLDYNNLADFVKIISDEEVLNYTLEKVLNS